MSVARWVGRERVKRRFRELPRVAQRMVAEALGQGADEIVQMQKRLAPKDDGDLQEAIHRRWDRRAALMGIVIRAWSPKVKYAHLVEFGTAPHRVGGRFKGAMHPGTKAQPFFFPAYRALRKRVKSRVRRSLRKAVEASRNV